MGVRPPSNKGIPTFRIKEYLIRTPQGRHILSCRGFPEARPAYWEAPETLQPKWVFTSGETEVRGIWVFSPGETPDARKVGVSPGRDWSRRRVFPGRD